MSKLYLCFERGAAPAPALSEGRPRCPPPPSGPHRLRAAPPGLRRRGATRPRRRGGTAGADTCSPRSRGSHRAGTPRRGSCAPPAVPPHPQHPRSPQPGIGACTGSCSPPKSVFGAGAWDRRRGGVGGWCTLRGAPRRPPRRDGPAGPRRPLGLAGAALPPPQAESSHEVKLKARNDQ